jgi:hypothetical protein
MRSVVLRGSIASSKRPEIYAQQSIDSIRTWHDGELILSTWTDQLGVADTLTGIDKIVYCDDPGEGPVQQLMRQVMSFYNGVNNVSGNEVMVTRTDMLHFKDLFELRNKFPKKTKENVSAFNEKLLIGNMMTIRPGAEIDISTYRPGDWFHVGTKEDMMRMGDVCLDIQDLDYSVINEQRNRGEICTENLWFRLVLKKHWDNNLSIYDWPNLDHLAMNALIDNFEIINTISTAKSVNLNWSFQPEKLECYFTEEQYQKEYKVLCESQSY